MLDNVTKRRIDTARDILVGKVPDPKSQVEQITIALIYKFMDDMDAEAEALGGKRSFFVGEYEKYGWARLMQTGRGGYEVLALYGEAITKMTENEGLPLLFRDIFKNAYLPYRDPETLKSFLKIIDEFNYDHSEKLGDAFEYLLSVLGSQGDAGQFRTPRHIIDFMVQVIDPQKGESILDPACGTAGFLISAYKHILNQNARDGVPGRALTPDERSRLMARVRGYDISPDMVRLSLVNLYLHGFNSPLIFEYDTLTSEERWNEYFDVIMANPPFMSPKGGIRPHNRFSVQSSRSEVLFVDYIAEHLSPNGRAAIIVPEGVIFQSSNAYKKLRKMLVEDNYLVGVISLPAGVFNPYSGVKTSILWLDKALAKQTDQIAFVKIENDGFNLGAQRREIKQNDLPKALMAINAYKASIFDGSNFDAKNYSCLNLVSTEQISEDGDYNLSAERYKISDLGLDSDFPLVEIGELCTFEYGKSLTKADRVPGEYPVFGSNGIVGYHNEFLVEAPFLVVGRKGSAGAVTYSDKNGFPIDTTFYIKLENEKLIKLKYLYHLLQSLDLENVNVQSGIPGLNRNDAYKITIPLPPIEVQEEIVAEIEGYQKIIDGARQVVENYRPRIPIDPDWPMVELGDVLKVDGNLVKDLNGYQDFYYIGGDNIESGTGNLSDLKTISKKRVRGPVYMFRENQILYNKIRPYLSKATISSFRGFCSSDMYPLSAIKKANVRFLLLYLLSEDFQSSIEHFYSRARIPKINREQLYSVKIPFPEITTQDKVVVEIEAEQAMVEATSQLITRFEQKIKERIARVWGEE